MRCSGVGERNTRCSGEQNNKVVEGGMREGRGIPYPSV